MVTFVCESCNETLKKNQVEKHGNRCRQCHVTCVDCSRTFSLAEYSQHTSCVSEAEKYEKTLYKAKANVKINPQDAWMQLIAEAATRKTEAPSNISEHLGRLSELDNVPRNFNKFANFAKNSLRLNNSSIVDGIWKFLEKLKAEKDYAARSPPVEAKEVPAAVISKDERGVKRKMDDDDNERLTKAAKKEAKRQRKLEKQCVEELETLEDEKKEKTEKKKKKDKKDRKENKGGV